MTSPISPVYVRDSETSADTYMFPDWGIGMIIAAGILLIFIMLCCVVLVRGTLTLTLLNFRLWITYCKLYRIKHNFYPTNIYIPVILTIIFLSRNQNVSKPTLKTKSQERDPVELDLWVNNFWKRE